MKEVLEEPAAPDPIHARPVPASSSPKCSVRLQGASIEETFLPAKETNARKEVDESIERQSASAPSMPYDTTADEPVPIGGEDRRKIAECAPHQVSIAPGPEQASSHPGSSRPPLKLLNGACSLFGEARDISTTRSYRKWRSMKARNLKKFLKEHPQTYYRRMRRGVPQRFRWEAWKEVVRLDEIMSGQGCEWALRLRPIDIEGDESPVKSEQELRQMAQGCTPVELYETLANKPSKFTSLVDIDVARTFPEISVFDSTIHRKLYRILNAYANFAPHVGYCQGMNFVAGFILLVSSFAPEVDVFWFFVHLMGVHNVHGFFRECFPLLASFIKAFDELADHYTPEIRQHFLRENVLPPVYLHQWYLTLFVTSLPLGTVAVVWDSLMCSGLHSLLPLTLALLKVLQSFLLRLKFEGIVKFLKSLRSSGDCDETKIGRMLVRQAENYPLIASVYPLVVDIDWAHLLREAYVSGRRDRTLSADRTKSLIVDFDSPALGKETEANPLGSAVAASRDLCLQANSDDENSVGGLGRGTCSLIPPSNEVELLPPSSPSDSSNVESRDSHIAKERSS